MLSELFIRIIPLLPRPLVQRVAGRYVAGDSADSAITLAAALYRQGFVTTLDMLGEDVTTTTEAQATVDAYVSLMRAMTGAGLERNISIKLTQLGLRLDRDHAFELLRRLLEEAATGDFFVRFDMEDASVTDITLDFYRRAREIWPRVGAVLQSRLRRTVDDARQLAAEGANIRLCKGIYPESDAIAFTGANEIRESYLTSLRLLLDGGCYVGVATHDPNLIRKAELMAGETGDTPVSSPTATPGSDAGPGSDGEPGSGGESRGDQRGGRRPLEFQALLGVPIRTRLERLRDTGFKVRIYVPFGQDWYAYGLRRLRENPQVAVAIARSIFSHDHLSTRSGSDADKE